MSFYKVSDYANDLSVIEPTKVRIPDEKDVRKIGTNDVTIKTYLPKLRQILEGMPAYGTPPEPSEVYERVYIGSTSNSEHLPLFKRYGFTHVLNCDGVATLKAARKERYKPEWGVQEYMEIETEEGAHYDITQHFIRAFRFIDHARNRGRILLYSADVNTSGAIAIGYLIHKGYTLLDAAKRIKHVRYSVLFNKGFMRQLILYAKDHCRLEGPTKHHLQLEQYGQISEIRKRVRDAKFLRVI